MYRQPGRVYVVRNLARKLLFDQSDGDNLYDYVLLLPRVAALIDSEYGNYDRIWALIGLVRMIPCGVRGR